MGSPDQQMQRNISPIKNRGIRIAFKWGFIIGGIIGLIVGIFVGDGSTGSQPFTYWWNVAVILGMMIGNVIGAVIVASLSVFFALLNAGIRHTATIQLLWAVICASGAGVGIQIYVLVEDLDFSVERLLVYSFIVGVAGLIGIRSGNSFKNRGQTPLIKKTLSRWIMGFLTGPIVLFFVWGNIIIARTLQN